MWPYTTVMQDAWSRGQKVTLHGWIYGLQDGLLQNLHMTVSGNRRAGNVFRNAFKRYPRPLLQK